MRRKKDDYFDMIFEINEIEQSVEQFEEEEEKKARVLPEHSRYTQAVYDWAKTIVTSVSVVVLLLTFVFRMTYIDGPSMENTLHDGDRVILTNIGYSPEVGDIVAISKGMILEETLIKRIIALEGQTIKIDYDKGQVIVDGAIIDEPYIKDLTRVRSNWEIPYVIPEGFAFVMGDNREISRDSRDFEIGLIDVDNIIGKAQFRIYPFERFGYLY